jgi:pyrroloquinoline-quinone synthase
MSLWTPEEFTEQLRAVGVAHYHDKHPFHQWMNEGKLDRDQLCTWVVNRLYYQINIPVKDALILAKCPVRSIRQTWIQRIVDHDGTADQPGGIEKWLRLGEGMGLTRGELENGPLLPGVRYAVDAYVEFVRTKPWVEAIASSLTELFAPKLMKARLEAFEKYYTWIDKDALAYFRARLTQAPKDSDHGLAVVIEYCTTREMQQKAVDAVTFKCDLLWAQLDAIYYHCVSPTRPQAV